MANALEFPNTGDSKSVDRGDLKDDVAALRSDVEKLFGDMTKLSRQKVSDGLESGAEIKDAMEKRISELTEDARVYVRDNPIAACATAAAVGFAAALLMKR